MEQGIADGRGYATMNLNGTGIVNVSGGLGESPTGLAYRLQSAESFGATRRPNDRGFDTRRSSTNLSVRVVGDLQSDLFGPVLDSLGTLDVKSDFGSTVTWGGITSVADVATGAVLDGWTIRSDSGFDYSHPYPVPEPPWALC